MTPADEREGECPKTTGFCRMPRKLHDMVCKDCGCVYVSDDHFENDDGPESNQWAIQYAEHCNVAHAALAALRAELKDRSEEAERQYQMLECVYSYLIHVRWKEELPEREIALPAYPLDYVEPFILKQREARRALSEAEGKKP